MYNLCMPTSYGTRQLRKSLANIVSDLKEQILIFNERKPGNSFYIVDVEHYHNLLKISHNADKAKELENFIENKYQERSNRFKATVLARYE